MIASVGGTAQFWLVAVFFCVDAGCPFPTTAFFCDGDEDFHLLTSFSLLWGIVVVVVVVVGVVVVGAGRIR